MDERASIGREQFTLIDLPHFFGTGTIVRLTAHDIRLVRQQAWSPYIAGLSAQTMADKDEFHLNGS